MSGERGPTTWRLGTSSWSEKSWVGPFYPPGTKPGDFLIEYAKRFASVEADTTYYRSPARALVQGWARKTPAGFVLSAKFPRAIVHGGDGERPDPERALVPSKVGDDAQRFVDAMAEMGSKLGPLLLQFPYFNQKCFASVDAFLERLGPFLDALPVGPRYAVEIRNKGWYGEPLLALLRERRAALALSDLVYLPHPADLARSLDLVTTDWLYFRLIGDRQAVEAASEGRFDRIVVDQETRLGRWAFLLGEVGPRVREVYGYANNHYAGFGPATIRDLALRLGVGCGPEDARPSPEPAG